MKRSTSNVILVNHALVVQRPWDFLKFPRGEPKNFFLLFLFSGHNGLAWFVRIMSYNFILFLIFLNDIV
jgi:hypothetical protein